MERAESTAKPVRRVGCPGCGYDLTGLPAGVCPECGRGFDPSDPSSVWDTDRRNAARRARRRRVAAVALVVAAVVGLASVGVLPRPAIGPSGGVQWGCWVWMGRAYGVQRVDLYVEQLRIHRWGSRVSRVESFDVWGGPRPRLLWSMERTGDRFRWEVADPSAEWDSVLVGFNTMRTEEEIFGLAVTPMRRRADTTFVMEGDRVDVMERMLEVYGGEVRTWVAAPGRSMVWVWDAERGELEEMAVERALELGVDVRGWNGAQVDRIGVGW